MRRPACGAGAASAARRAGRAGTARARPPARRRSAGRRRCDGVPAAGLASSGRLELAEHGRVLGVAGRSARRAGPGWLGRRSAGRRRAGDSSADLGQRLDQGQAARRVGHGRRHVVGDLRPQAQRRDAPLVAAPARSRPAPRRGSRARPAGSPASASRAVEARAGHAGRPRCAAPATGRRRGRRTCGTPKSSASVTTSSVNWCHCRSGSAPTSSSSVVAVDVGARPAARSRARSGPAARRRPGGRSGGGPGSRAGRRWRSGRR